MLKVENLDVRYGAIRAVNGISLEVNKGEMVALLGANGAGKSSTLLAVAGALKAASGRILLDGEDITALPPERIVRRGIAMVPETRDVFPDLTVMENLRLGGYIHRHDGQGNSEDLARVMDLFPILKERGEQAAGTLSGGEQQQLVIARALMSRPRLLLLDEPSLGLAPKIVDQIFALIDQMRSMDITILLVEQNATQSLQLADRAYVLSLGQVAASGKASEILKATDIKAIYLGQETRKKKKKSRKR
ncbi:MAG: ABC transporter ATP-binding protein [Hyphomicrobiaceae bacterium]|nr:ABC transporter ATP-binding protein [Hyphomicrobiaceae bacterium]